MMAMKDLFPEYYEPTEDQIQELWQNAVFVVDANVLLDLYRWSEETREDTLHALRKLAKQNRLWLPHQAAREYLKNRPKVIANAANAYDQVLKAMARDRRNRKKELESKWQPFVEPRKIDKWLEACDELQDGLKDRQTRIHSLKSKDTVRDDISAIFDGRIGEPFSKERITQIADEGASRFRRMQPPGYLDAEYDEAGDVKWSGFGDLIIWFQMMEKADVQGTALLLVTGDLKEDWWWKSDDKTRVGPRPELIAEMREKAGVAFYMYRPGEFLSEAKERLEIEIGDQSVDEVAHYEMSAGIPAAAMQIDHSWPTMTVDMRHLDAVQQQFRVLQDSGMLENMQQARRGLNLLSDTGLLEQIEQIPRQLQRLQNSGMLDALLWLAKAGALRHLIPPSDDSGETGTDGSSAHEDPVVDMTGEPGNDEPHGQDYIGDDEDDDNPPTSV